MNDSHNRMKQGSVTFDATELDMYKQSLELGLQAIRTGYLTFPNMNPDDIEMIVSDLLERTFRIGTAQQAPYEFEFYGTNEAEFILSAPIIRYSKKSIDYAGTPGDTNEEKARALLDDVLDIIAAEASVDILSGAEMWEKDLED